MIISGSVLKQLTSTCFVYIWRRSSGECLYIGQSRYGFRRLVTHDIIGKADILADDDTLEIMYCEVDEVDSIERRLIESEKPRFNRQTEEYRAKIIALRNQNKRPKPVKRKVKWYWEGPKWMWRYED
jgi:predicted GIY-YIG superfamily endonuclease